MELQRMAAVVIATASALSMIYVGLYQVRAVRRLYCPLFARGCEAVADAPFARPFGVRDGWLGAALYALIVLLLLAPLHPAWTGSVLIALTGLGVIANVLGVYDMVKFGQYCFYCTVTALCSPLLAWLVWPLR